MLQNPELHYLDNAATTIVAPEVADVIDKAMREHWANPSSLYARCPERGSTERRPRRRGPHPGLQEPGALFYPAAARATTWPCWARP